MSTYGTMRARVLDELNRAGEMTSQALSAIQSAIDHYEKMPFWFNDGRATTTTVAGTEWYPLPTDFISENKLLILVNGASYELRRIAFEESEELYQPYAISSGNPYLYAIFQEQIRLYPIPNGAFTITLSYHKALSTLTNEGDTNAWMTDGEELIRSRAEADLSFRILRDKSTSDYFRRFEEKALSRLVSTTSRRFSTGKTRRRSI